MLKAVKETDRFGKQQVHFYLTQGDTCTLYSIPYKDGERLPLEDVEKCIFKLSDLDYKQEFEKECVLVDDRFVLKLTHEETSQFSVNQHIYEFEYTLIGDNVNTPIQYYFDIVDQIVL